jgi:hypothetical protein
LLRKAPAGCGFGRQSTPRTAGTDRGNPEAPSIYRTTRSVYGSTDDPARPDDPRSLCVLWCQPLSLTHCGLPCLHSLLAPIVKRLYGAKRCIQQLGPGQFGFPLTLTGETLKNSQSRLKTTLAHLPQPRAFGTGAGVGDTYMVVVGEQTLLSSVVLPATYPGSVLLEAFVGRSLLPTKRTSFVRGQTRA